MQAFHATGEQQLRWVPAGHAPRRYALQSGDSLLATLTWAGHARVVGDWLGKRVTFAFEGWVRPRVVAREEDASPALTTEPLTTEPFATFTRRTGLLLFSDGQ